MNFLINQSTILNYTGLSDIWKERIIMIYVYFLALYFTVKEWFLEFLNPGIIQKIDDDFASSKVNEYIRKMALVTGADGTIGREIIFNLIDQGFTVHALVGDLEKARLLFRDQLQKGSLKIFEVNLLNPTEVVEFGNSYKNSSATFHLVILNAGIMLAKETYVDDIESHMCVNVVSQALLLELLQARFVRETRIVVVSSACSHAAYIRDPLTGDSILKSYYGPYQAYANSKFFLSIYVTVLTQRRNLKIVSVHPGVVPGTLYRNLGTLMKAFIYVVLPHFMRSPQLSAQLVIHCGLRNDLVPGEYYEDCGIKTISGKINADEQNLVFLCIQETIQSWKERFTCKD